MPARTEQYLYKLSWSVARKVRYEIMTINVLNFSHIPHKTNITRERKFQEMNITIIKQPSKHVRNQFDSIRIFFEWYVLWNKTLQVEFWRTVVLEARFSWVFHFLDRPTCFEEGLAPTGTRPGFLNKSRNIDMRSMWVLCRASLTLFVWRFFFGEAQSWIFVKLWFAANCRVSIDAKKNEPILCKDGLGQLWIWWCKLIGLKCFFFLYCANTYVYVKSILKSCSLYKNVRPPHDHPRLEVVLAFCNVPAWISWRAFCRFGLRYQCSRYSMLVTMCCAGERRWGEIGGQRGFSLECSMKILRYINRPTPNNQHQGLRNTKCHPKKG